jgi:hypothetical protein
MPSKSSNPDPNGNRKQRRAANKIVKKPTKYLLHRTMHNGK